MMIGVVSGGTGTRGARSRACRSRARPAPPSWLDRQLAQNPKNTDAWFVAFAPADNPKVAVAVMMVGAGFGGTAAAPIAKQGAAGRAMR